MTNRTELMYDSALEKVAEDIRQCLAEELQDATPTMQFFQGFLRDLEVGEAGVRLECQSRLDEYRHARETLVKEANSRGFDLDGPSRPARFHLQRRKDEHQPTPRGSTGSTLHSATNADQLGPM